MGAKRPEAATGDTERLAAESQSGDWAHEVHPAVRRTVINGDVVPVILSDRDASILRAAAAARLRDHAMMTSRRAAQARQHAPCKGSDCAKTIAGSDDALVRSRLILFVWRAEWEAIGAERPLHGFRHPWPRARLPAFFVVPRDGARDFDAGAAAGGHSQSGLRG